MCCRRTTPDEVMHGLRILCWENWSRLQKREMRSLIVHSHLPDDVRNVLAPFPPAHARPSPPTTPYPPPKDGALLPNAYARRPLMLVGALNGAWLFFRYNPASHPT